MDRGRILGYAFVPLSSRNEGWKDGFDLSKRAVEFDGVAVMIMKVLLLRCL